MQGVCAEKGSTAHTTHTATSQTSAAGGDDLEVPSYGLVGSGPVLRSSSPGGVRVMRNNIEERDHLGSNLHYPPKFVCTSYSLLGVLEQCNGASPALAPLATRARREWRQREENYYAGAWHECGWDCCWCTHSTCPWKQACLRNNEYVIEWDWAPSQQWDKPNPHSPVQHAMRSSQVAVSLDVDITSIYACR